MVICYTIGVVRKGKDMPNAIQQLLEKFLALTNEEQTIFFNAMVASRSGERINDMGMAFKDDIRFRDGIVCPYCGSKGKGVYKRGQTKVGKQRFYCEHCGKTFTSATNTILAWSHNDSTIWKKYIECMMLNMSVRKSAKKCGISKNTSFAWRHKILDSLQTMANGVKMDGIIESDETFFHLSYKGNHKKSKHFTMPRKAHKRGSDIHTRGISHEQVCVPSAVNRNGLSIAKITNLGRVDKNAIEGLFKGRFNEGSIVCTDAHKAYANIADAFGVEHIAIDSKKRMRGSYGIQHINSYHSILKLFLAPFKGVSTKYLNNYLIWHNFENIAKETPTEKERILWEFIETNDCISRCYDMSMREAVPLLAA